MRYRRKCNFLKLRKLESISLQNLGHHRKIHGNASLPSGSVTQWAHITCGAGQAQQSVSHIPQVQNRYECVSVSCGCSNRLPQIWWLKTTDTYSLTDSRNPESHRCKRAQGTRCPWGCRPPPAGPLLEMQILSNISDLLKALWVLVSEFAL